VVEERFQHVLSVLNERVELLRQIACGLLE
jgi:hypothetical protein